ncbi:MAG: ABC transporter ATP-binding protein/permease [Alphaproteobacteria bacterium]|nr:ABC transporter ATP-binding protein/permease [Alphaproteobacteria bacterium]
MDQNLFKYIIRHSKSDQFIILGWVLLSQVFYFISLDLPKTIVNEAILGKSFQHSQTASLFSLSITVPDFLKFWEGPSQFILFEGINFERLTYLTVLSLIFLLLVMVNGWFKYYINTQKGRLGERMLRRLRFELLDRILRFPPFYFRKVKQAEIATMIKDEVEPLGGFIGDAFVQPVFLGGQALTALFFIVLQSTYLGLVTVGVLLIQIVIIPRMRRKVLELGKQRQITARQLAGRIAECVDGIVEIRTNDTSNYERAEFSSRLGLIYFIRFEIYQRKFMIKFLNNFLSQVTPFLFYLFGGYLAIKGYLDVGGLVAVIAAYKDLPSPIKELIDWDQQRQDVQIKYQQVIEQFDTDDISPIEFQNLNPETLQLEGKITFQNVDVVDDHHHKLLDAFNAQLDLKKHIAVVGPAGEGKEQIALLLARLVQPNMGKILINDQDWFLLPESMVGRRMSYIGQDSYLFSTTIRHNILYGLKHYPISEYEEKKSKDQFFIEEAQRSGNVIWDIHDNWIDYKVCGFHNSHELDQYLLGLLKFVGLEEEIYRFGLRTVISPEGWPTLADDIVKARKILREYFDKPEFKTIIEPFDYRYYNRSLAVGENILFGIALDNSFTEQNLSSNSYIHDVIKKAGLWDDFLLMGYKIAQTLTELLSDLPTNHPFFEQFGFFEEEDLPYYKSLVVRVNDKNMNSLSKMDKNHLMNLILRYNEMRHRLGIVTPLLQEKIVQARLIFSKGLPEKFFDSVRFYDDKAYNPEATLQDNVLFGKLAYGQSQAALKVHQLMTKVLDELNLRPSILLAGLDFEVGAGGKKLAANQRQKIGILRALFKSPDLLVLNQAASLFDPAMQQYLVESILEKQKKCAVVWVLHHAELAKKFDVIWVVKNNQIVESGSVEELDKDGTHFYAMIS